MFKDYLARQLSKRGNVYEKLGVSKSTFYRHLKQPNDITLGEFKQMILIGELDQEKVIDWLFYERERRAR